MSTLSLTPAQHAILAYALEHTGGRIEWFPDHIKGGARQKVLAGLANRALIARQGDGWVVADEGYGAMGRERPAPAPAAVEDDPEIEAAVTAAEAQWAAQQAAAQAPAQPRTRENERSAASRGAAERVRSTRQNSKQARVIAMLRRPEGATIRQIVETTGWQPHTVRGTLAGALKKKLGLTIVSEKSQGGERVYRLA
jgi:DNA-binding MarR family transcriptional regulator